MEVLKNDVFDVTDVTAVTKNTKKKDIEHETMPLMHIRTDDYAFWQECRTAHY